MLAGAVRDSDGYLAVEEDRCPGCGRVLRWTPDVLDELVQAVIDGGGAVEHVATGTPLAEHVAAATLRFPVPPRP